MKILVAISYDRNKVFLDMMKEIMGSELYNKQEIVTYPPTPGAQFPSLTPEELIKNLNDVDVLVIYGAPVTSKVIDSTKKLKLIVAARGGPVNVDIEYANKVGMPISYAPGHNAEAVTDHAMAIMLSLVRAIVTSDEIVKKGLWVQGQRPSYRNIFELKGKNFGIAGFGNIGRIVAQKAKGGFGMNILVYDPFVDEETIKKVGATKVDFETLLKQSDVITCHVRITTENYHMFGEKAFNLMKPTAYFINTSRGPAVDEKALYNAVKDNKIAGAGLDVFEEEPAGPNNPLTTLGGNMILTPHIGAAGTSYEVGARIAAEEVTRFVKGEKIRFVAKAEDFKFEREEYEKIFRGRSVH